MRSKNASVENREKPEILPGLRHETWTPHASNAIAENGAQKGCSSSTEGVDMIQIYAGPDACKKCLGWMRIANDEEQSSWKHWAELPPPSNLAVQLGLVYPIVC